jgi:hypothetical protein
MDNCPDKYLKTSYYQSVYSNKKFPDPQLLRKSGSAGNRAETSDFAAMNSDH